MSRMSLVESLQVLHRLRQPDQVVLSTMAAAREWMKLGTHPLDFIYAPSAMGEAPALGMGMALAQPDSQGKYTGFDVDICRALSAAIFGEPDKVKYVPLTAQQRFTALQSGEVDILDASAEAAAKAS